MAALRADNALFSAIPKCSISPPITSGKGTVHRYLFVTPQRLIVPSTYQREAGKTNTQPDRY
jgi:hypothetical protein